MTPVIVLDVNETLSDLRPMAERFEEVGLPGHLAPVWFCSVLRDGFALGVTGRAAPFAELADHALRVLLTSERPGRDAGEAVGHVLAGFAGLPLHPDVAPGLRSMRDSGHRLVTLSNGSSAVARTLLEGHGLADLVEHTLTVEDVGAWKPAAAAYHHAATVCGVPPGDLCLVAAHPWDVDGAAAAGLSSAYINRSGLPWPPHFTRPDHEVADFEELATVLGGPAQ